MMATKWQCNVMEIKLNLNTKVLVAVTLGKSLHLLSFHMFVCIKGSVIILAFSILQCGLEKY